MATKTIRYLRNVLLLFLALSCAGDRAASRERLLGMWRSDTYMSQLGKSVDTICFRDDGTVESLVETQAGRISTSGTYSLSRHSLTLNIKDSPYGPAIADVRVAGDVLTLVYAADRRTYRKVSPTCAIRDARTTSSGGIDRAGEGTRRPTRYPSNARIVLTKFE